jgi:hypothetical protein
MAQSICGSRLTRRQKKAVSAGAGALVGAGLATAVGRAGLVAPGACVAVGLGVGTGLLAGAVIGLAVYSLVSD